MSKKLNEDLMQSELTGSAFFKQEPATSPEEESHHSVLKDTTLPRDRESMPPRAHATMPPWQQGAEIVEAIRKTVRQLGREEATLRLTGAEKQSVAAVVYSYGLAGIKTSQNEITRIALNSLLADYEDNGNESVLARVLTRLNE